MNADKLTAETAFDAGADLWVLSEAQNGWWQNIDFRTGFLLSHCLLFQKKEPASRLEAILTETQIKRINFSSDAKSLLLGTENHFFNKWILVWSDLKEEALADSIAELSTKLKFSSVRIFSDSTRLVAALTTRPSASSINISFIENT